MNGPLDSAALGVAVRIARVDWTAMSDDEGRRLREFGLMEGVEIVPLHRGSLFSRDPLALSVGRMRVIIRARQAAMILVEASQVRTGQAQTGQAQTDQAQAGQTEAGAAAPRPA